MNAPKHFPTTALAVLARGSAFALASSLAVCFPLLFGKMLWPQGLSAGAEFIFWPASAVNIAGLLLLGWRYWPVILLGILPAWLLLGESLEKSFLGAAGNGVEALLAWWILRRIGRVEGRLKGGFDRTRPVAALLLAAALAPVAGSLAVPSVLVVQGRFTPVEFWRAVANWNLANGAAILVLTPFLLAVCRGTWTARRRGEAMLWLGLGLLGGTIAFDAVFAAKGMNFAFLTFPFVIFVAIRFGPQETSAALLVVMVSIYGSLARHASELMPDQAPAILWFVQAFLWVLAATGLVVAALVAERREAERRAFEEQGRTLEASLREERARLDALRYQINPHFLFNALNSLRSTLPLSAEVPREMVTELSAYLRSTLARPPGPAGDFVPLKEEIESAEHYLAIEQARFGNELRVVFSVDPAAAARPVPVFLLQPLVENAIRHGLERSKGIFRLRIEARMAGARITVEVKNSGVWKETRPGGRRGLGLENIRRRLELLYGSDASMDIASDDGWVSIRLDLPAP